METNFVTTEQLVDHLISLIDNLEIDKKVELPKYATYGYSSVVIYFSSNEYYLSLSQECTSDYCRAFKRFGDAKKCAKKLITNAFI